MTLDEYMKKHQIKNVTIAKAVKLTDGFISKLRKKKTNPTLFNGFMISKYCNFEVTIFDLVSQEAFDAFATSKKLEKFQLSDFLNQDFI